MRLEIPGFPPRGEPRNSLFEAGLEIPGTLSKQCEPSNSLLEGECKGSPELLSREKPVNSALKEGSDNLRIPEGANP